jgi:drug/metabolite transporter superfamily protein YnfA
MAGFIPSITVLAAFALLAGAFYLWRKQQAKKQVLLMCVLAFVMLANVVIWTLPEPAAVGDADTARATP